MPKKTFLRLVPEKQERLMQAARTEFSRAPFSEASVSNIIKDAGIPRGSFYQYFEDKADIYFYLLKELRRNVAKLLKSTLDQEDGDIFRTVKQTFAVVIQDIVSGDNSDLYRNVFLHLDFAGSQRLTPPPFFKKGQPHKQLSSEMAYFLSHIDRSQLRLQNDEQLHMLLRQLVFVLMTSIGFYYSKESREEVVTVEDVDRHFLKMLDWLENGVRIKSKQIPTSGNKDEEGLS